MNCTGGGVGGISADNPVIARPYAVAMFDILGFKQRFAGLGLKGIVSRYATLIDRIVQRNIRLQEQAHLFPGLKEGPYWCAEGEIVVLNQVHAAYGSDTFMVWANYTWTDLHRSDQEQLDKLASDSSHDWLFQPVPCDAFLDTCNELMCRSLQVGLPLRGALAVGDAVMDDGRRLFLGEPIIEADLLERGQKFRFFSQLRGERHTADPADLLVSKQQTGAGRGRDGLYVPAGRLGGVRGNGVAP